MKLPAPKAFRELWDAVATDSQYIAPALPESALPFFLSHVPAPKSGRPVVVVLAERSGLSLTTIARASAAWRQTEVVGWTASPLPVLILPLLLLQERRGDIPTPRLRTFWQVIQTLRESEQNLILATTRELRQPSPGPTTDLGGIALEEGHHLRPQSLAARLLDLGYVEEKAAEEPGTFARRGDLMDIFPFHVQAPIRVEYAGNTMERIRSLRRERASGVNGEKENGQWEAVYARVTGSGRTRFSVYPLGLPKKLSANVSNLLDVAYVIAEEGALASGKRVDLLFTPFHEGTPGGKNPSRASSGLVPAPAFGGDAEKLKAALRDSVTAGDRVYLLSARPASLQSTLQASDTLHILPTDAAAEIRGFSDTEEQLHFWTDADLGEAPEDTPLTEAQGQAYARRLTPKDYAVHRDHGIARFRGIERKTFENSARDYLVLEYAQRDRLFVPVELAQKVTLYVGAANPVVHRLGGTEWETTTRAVRAEATDLARELLALYAARAVESGTAYPPDTEADKKLASSFVFDETPDQAAAIREVRQDMERSRPMDRLVSGDVGFGKTEVAIRAAYKAVNFGRQVAVLSPTTLLAQQHVDTFRERLVGTTVRTALLSRFQTPAEEKSIVKDLAAGRIDIVIGTHRLLSDDITFKNLGLLIIDEEQKFGVEQKETLKKFRSAVDVLSLSATPIPRTLHMALAGLRSLSVIATAPKARRPVITKVARESDTLMKSALELELERGGQSYVLWNRVETIDAAAERIRALVPGARIVVAHGQMPETELMRVMEQFDTKAADILVCSTIIENGIDLPNVNTLIVFDAPSFGLSDLYQLRGRVGRGNQQAYAIFFYTQGRLPFEARKRLAALLEAVELGSGWTLALRDLEIRGAGNLLGREQHGTIRAVGIHLFGELLKEEVEKLQSGTVAPSTADIQVDLPVKAFLPEVYIPHLESRLAAYARFSSARTPPDLTAARTDLEATFGPLPPEAEQFLSLLQLKFLAQEAGVAAIAENGVQGGAPRPAASSGTSAERRITLTFREGLTPVLAYAAISDNPRWTFTGSTMSMTTAELLSRRSGASRWTTASDVGGELLENVAHILRILSDMRRKEAAGKVRLPNAPKKE